MNRGWIEVGSRMDRGWSEDGSGMDWGWIEDRSRMDRGWIEDGWRMDRGWIEDGSLPRAQNFVVLRYFGYQIRILRDRFTPRGFLLEAVFCFVTFS